MKTVELAKATEPLSDYVRRAAKDPLLVVSRGRAVAALVRISQADRERLAVSSNARFQSIVRKARRQVAAGKSYSSEEVRRVLGIMPRKRRSR